MKKFSLLIFLILTSCISRFEKHGYMFDMSDSHLLQEGITGKEKTLSIMGSPTLISDLSGDESWIYYAENIKYFLFFFPEVKERNILVVRFDDNNIIKELLSLNLDDEDKKITFSSRHTAVDSHNVGFFKSIISNVGQVKPQ